MERFAFGENWANFVEHVDGHRTMAARFSLSENLGKFHGKKFLDVGSGSGLFSLAAHQLGARVVSFDYDAKSVECTRKLSDGAWRVEQGSILDSDYINQLDTHDIVYSWGVLHHTGNMTLAFENAAKLVAPGGQLMIAIYNDQGWKSRYWTAIKRLFNRGWKRSIIALHLPILIARFGYRLITGRLRDDRGMSLWYDYIDWLGGYPFEVATKDEVRKFFESRGFTLEKCKDVGRRSGCNEFVFRRHAASL